MILLGCQRLIPLSPAELPQGDNEPLLIGSCYSRIRGWSHHPTASQQSCSPAPLRYPLCSTARWLRNIFMWLRQVTGVSPLVTLIELKVLHRLGRHSPLSYIPSLNLTQFLTRHLARQAMGII
jgi:hypothetical protein